jgi:D-glucuronyl C5-epimerase C-terminus
MRIWFSGAVLITFSLTSVPLLAVAEVLSIPIESPAPAVRFKIAEPDKDGKLTLFPPVDFSSIRKKFDQNGVYETTVDGKPSRHIADLAKQASGMESSNLDTDAALRDDPGKSKVREAALEWLRANAIPLENGAVTWRNTFPLPFNNLLLTSDWPSAYSQADVIKTLLLAAKREDVSYRALALCAGLAYTIPCERGGLRCTVEGYPWFEEVPLPYGYAPMILNGHLYSLVMLHRLFDETDDPRIEAAFREGFDSAKSLLMHFDTGYWSVYDIRPREEGNRQLPPARSLSYRVPRLRFAK